MGGACGTYGRLERLRKLRDRDHLEIIGVNEITDLILKWMIKKWDTEAWTGLIWLRIGTGSGLLTVMNFQVHRMRGISGLDEELLASPEGLYFMEREVVLPTY
jgi:hypothetical protein